MVNQQQEILQEQEQIQLANIIDKGLYEISLSTLVTNLEVICESIVDFENLNTNRFDLSLEVTAQKWEVFFNRLKGLVYSTLVKKFWIHAKTSNY